MYNYAGDNNHVWYVFIQLRKLKVSDTSEQWKITAQGRERYLAVGTRDTLIVVSSESLEGPDIVPRLEVELTKNDIEKLQRLNLPNQWKDDASILVARYKMDKTDECNVVGVERSIPGDGLTKKYVLEEIKSLMTSTTKDGGKRTLHRYTVVMKDFLR